MMKACGSSLWYTKLLIQLYGHLVTKPNVSESIDWATAGYRGCLAVPQFHDQSLIVVCVNRRVRCLIRGQHLNSFGILWDGCKAL
jgi:hypothetical protein